jgi:hypothetical protein
MPEFKRVDPLSIAEAAERDSRAEALLVEGLDQYFAGRFDDAIHVWTRVLFLDRSHARARAYIDRARTALAETQRRVDEMLHTADDLVERGQLDQARHVFGQIVAAAGDDERVAALRTRLDRLERAGVGLGPLAPAAGPAAVHDVVPVGRRRTHVVSIAALVTAAALGALFVTAITSPAVRDWVGAGPAASPLAPAAAPATPAVLSRSDVALIRARTLYAHGRLAEALAALDTVVSDSASRQAADDLRVEVQQILLSTRPSSTAPSGLAGHP